MLLTFPQLLIVLYILSLLFCLCLSISECLTAGGHSRITEADLGGNSRAEGPRVSRAGKAGVVNEQRCDGSSGFKPGEQSVILRWWCVRIGGESTVQLLGCSQPSCAPGEGLGLDHGDGASHRVVAVPGGSVDLQALFSRCS